MAREEEKGGARRISLHGHWSSRLAFVLAVTGSAVGLGNIWKFPYVAGQNGGGAWVLVYLVCVALVGLPVMMSEILIGRRGRRNPVSTMALLGEEEGGTSKWRIVGFVGVLAGMLILSYYSVIGGWVLAYIPKSVAGLFTAADPDRVAGIFADLTGSWVSVTVGHTVFMAVTIAIVARGVERGLEQAVRLMVPALVVLLLVLLAFAISSGGFAQGVSFMFTADFSALTWDGVLQAMGQAFFTLSIGMGAVMAYGAYVPEGTSITKASIAVVTADTGIAILAGLVTFPLVFANQLDPADGPGLVFVTLPLAFGKMAGGVFFATIFFIVLMFAAWTSALGLLEPAVAWVVERHNRPRGRAAVMVGAVIWLLGLGIALSFNVLADFTTVRGSLYQNIEYLTSNIMLPLGGLLITIFAGWVVCGNSSAEELGGVRRSYRIWRFLSRFLAPAAILVVFLQAVGLI